MKRRLVIFAFLITQLPAFGQDDLDEIFDDGLNKSHLALGTDVITDLTGTINVYANIRPIDAMRIQLGIGVVPFGKYTDLMNLIGERLPVRDTALSIGFYNSFGLQLVKETPWPGFDYYYYVDLKRWQYQAVQDQFKVKKFKGCFGLGYSLQISGGLSFDMTVGVYLGREKVNTTENFMLQQFGDVEFHGTYYNAITTEGSTFFNGFDIGLGLHYNFKI